VRAVYDGISGFLTDDLGHVVAVKYAPFDFSGFVFTDVEAKHLSNLTELQALTLPMMGNQVTDEGVKALSSLSKLEYLAMSGTEKVTSSGFSHLGSLQNLKGLGLGMSPINDDGLSNLAGLSQLEFLDLTGAKIGDRGIGHLRGLKSLQSLALVSTAAQTTETGHTRLQYHGPGNGRSGEVQKSTATGCVSNIQWRRRDHRHRTRASQDDQDVRIRQCCRDPCNHGRRQRATPGVAEMRSRADEYPGIR